MKYAALAVLLVLVVTAALFLRTDRDLGVKRISYSFYKDELYDGFYRRAGVDFQAKWNREHPDDPIEVRYDPDRRRLFPQDQRRDRGRDGPGHLSSPGTSTPTSGAARCWT